MNLDYYIDALFFLENRFIKTITPSDNTRVEIRKMTRVSYATIDEWFNPAPSYPGFIPRGRFESTLRDNMERATIMSSRRKAWAYRTVLGNLFYDGIQQNQRYEGDIGSDVLEANSLHAAVELAHEISTGIYDRFLCVAFVDMQLRPLLGARYALDILYTKVDKKNTEAFLELYYEEDEDEVEEDENDENDDDEQDAFSDDDGNEL